DGVSVGVSVGVGVTEGVTAGVGQYRIPSRARARKFNSIFERIWQRLAGCALGDLRFLIAGWAAQK
ncbi:MAG: hypothetical protein RMN25_13330, partial [Anaerolineae bacterium]|nr:hypothetical protein [Thermoflexales bacterium]MDW8408756.1 hypothetical protein [Anaerolineae bacterium]